MDEVKTETKSKLVPGYMEPQILADLRQYLDQQDMVILIDTQGSNPLTDVLCRSEAVRKTDKRMAIIGPFEFPMKPGKHIYRTVSKREMRMLLDIYRSYEVSDKLFLFSDSHDYHNYGSAWNYVDSGMISEREMFEAMFA